MSDQKVLEVQRGIWIDEQAIRSANLGGRLRIVVQPGEIRILAVPPETESGAIPKSEKGWEVFRSLGRDARPGQLQNAAQNHDRYLYGKGQ